MNLRNIGSYTISLDLGTGSVGWAVTDEQGDLLHFKGKPTWGSRLFPSAETAASARMPRGQRRRYIRRRWRLDLLQEFFKDDIETVDPDFFVRLRQSSLWPEDKEERLRFSHYPFFNETDFTEQDYYVKFPTIFHLRQWLIETDEKADLRLVYLALHNIVKHRGNFLQEDNESLSAKNADMRESIETFCDALSDWCEEKGLFCDCDTDALVDLLGGGSRRGDVRDTVPELLNLGKAVDTETDVKALGKEIAKAFVGYKADFSKIFSECEADGSSFRLSDDEGPELFLEMCPDDGVALFESIQMVYSSYVLMGMLTEKGLSLSKISAYDQYGKDLHVLKSLVREYVPANYDEFFRGEKYEGSSDYDVSKAQGYTRYNLGLSKKGSGVKPMAYDDFRKCVENLFKDTEALADERYKNMMDRFSEEKFLRRLRTSDNGPIPFQLNLEEMISIINNQGRHYPFLTHHKDELESLVRFRIPYYVGPLTKENARCDAKGKPRFAWSERREGKEDEAITPWNWEEIIDKHRSAQSFIERMTGTCTYLQDESVLPRCSLLYEEFCVLNELNGAKWTQDGDKFSRFDYRDRADMVDELFKKRRVTYAQVEDWMAQRGHSHSHVSGGQGERGFESKLSSYVFFCKDVFHVDELPESYYPMVEDIILWNTLFEDRSILRVEIERAYGDKLNEEQIKTICKKRFVGWGRLSKRLLTDLRTQTDNGLHSVMDILREGDQNNGRIGRSMILQEVLHDDDLGFEKRIAEFNEEILREKGGTRIEDLPGSPALRRTINQAIRIVDEIASITGKPPANIFIEETRDDDPRLRGRRTTARYNSIKNALAALKDEGGAALKELDGIKPAELDKRMSLYFMQNGKSLYSGKPLDIRCLSEYQIDHIIPQSYIKDDSYENLALVLPSENQSKSDNMLISNDIRVRMKLYWTALHDAKLIGDKKYNNLLRPSISEAKIKGFIARQLVETSQIVKTTRQILSEKYPETAIRSIKASLSSQLRDVCGFVKCREINDYHHAHDAYIASQLGRFIQKRHHAIFDNPIGMTAVMRSFIKQQGTELNRTGRLPASAGKAGFLVQSFLRSGFDEETGEIFKDDWNASCEIARIAHSLDYRDCFISRMPEETSGAFWDATIYSPKSGKNLSISIKEGMSVEKYGGYSGEQFAYFFAYKSYNPKKKQYGFEFEAVPIHIASDIGSNREVLKRYASQLAGEKSLEFVEIVRPKIYKYQLIELDEDRLYITGLKKARNATQFSFSQCDTEVFLRLVSKEETSSDERQTFFETLREKYRCYAPRLGILLKVDDLQMAFLASSEDDQSKALASLVSLANAKDRMADLSCIGKGKGVGCIQPTYTKEMSSPVTSFSFIDQSVTGMFERRQRLEL